MDEDTASLSQLQWAKILVKLDGKDFPSTLQVVVDSLSFSLQLWWKGPS